MSAKEFAVIQFADEGFEVIRTNWAVFDKSDTIIASYFPNVTSQKEINDLLQKNPEKDEVVTWTDEKGKPWPVKTVCCYAQDITNDDNLRNPNVRPHRSGHGSSRFKDSPEDLECFDKAQMLMLMKINTMGVMLESFCRNNGSAPDKPSSVSFTKKDTDLEMFPARSISEIEKIEKKMTHKQFFDKVVHALIKIGKHVTISMTITSMLNNLLTFETGTKYSFLGRSGKKKPFKALLLFKAICCAVDIVDPDATIALTTKSVKDWLYQCKNRQKREGENAKKAEEREKNMQLHLEEDVEEDDS